MWIVNFHMFKLVLEKAEEPEIKLPTSAGSWKKQASSRKASISALLTMPKPWYVDHNKLWKILKEMGIADHLICLLRNLYWINFCPSMKGCVNCSSSRRLGNPKTISEHFQILLDLPVAFSSPNLWPVFFFFSLPKSQGLNTKFSASALKMGLWLSLRGKHLKPKVSLRCPASQFYAEPFKDNL